MRMRAIAALLIAAMIAALTLNADAADAKVRRTRRKRRPNPALKPIEPVEGLPNVLLIGDSISIGYTIPTRAILKGKANVHRIPTNGGDTRRGKRSIDKWLGERKWDVIHFNWGLHDLKRLDGQNVQVPIEEYEQNLREIVARLKQTGAKLIWASTTPLQDVPLKPVRLDSDAVKYNAVAKRIMDENGVAINDLYAFAMPQLLDIQRKANCHFSPQGSNALAEQVAAAIEKALAPE